LRFGKKNAIFGYEDIPMKRVPAIFNPKEIFLFYYNGFRNMTVGKSLWAIILIKLFIIFMVLKLFFFPDLLKEKFDTDEERGDYVIQELTKTAE
jgi:hypothetical protein